MGGTRDSSSISCRLAMHGCPRPTARTFSTSRSPVGDWVGPCRSYQVSGLHGRLRELNVTYASPPALRSKLVLHTNWITMSIRAPPRVPDRWISECTSRWRRHEAKTNMEAKKTRHRLKQIPYHILNNKFPLFWSRIPDSIPFQPILGRILDVESNFAVKFAGFWRPVANN